MDPNITQSLTGWDKENVNDITGVITALFAGNKLAADELSKAIMATIGGDKLEIEQNAEFGVIARDRRHRTIRFNFEVFVHDYGDPKRGYVYEVNMFDAVKGFRPKWSDEIVAAFLDDFSEELEEAMNAAAEEAIADSEDFFLDGFKG